MMSVDQRFKSKFDPVGTLILADFFGTDDFPYREIEAADLDSNHTA
jgi:hypothetical protein